MKLSVENPPPPYINLIPILDSIFILVFIFMFIIAQSTQARRQIYIEIPKKHHIKTPNSTLSPTIIQITEFNEFLLQNKMMDFEDLKRELQTLKSSQSRLSLVVSGDQNSNLGQTLRILNLAKELKIHSIKIETAESSTPKKEEGQWVPL